MTDTIIIKAEERLRAIELERRELEAFIATYRKLEGPASIPQSMSCAATTDLASPKEGRRPSSTREIVDAAMETLAAHKSPMKLRELYQALVAKGIVITGKVPRNNLGAKLSADTRLQSVKGLGWWFSGENPQVQEEPYPPRDLEDYYQKGEGPAIDDVGPSFTNGAIGVHPGDTATHVD
jgi:hypothetical protein